MEDEKVYDISLVKSRLISYREREVDIDLQIERLDRLETRLHSIGSPNFSDMPKTQSHVHDRTADLIIQKIELEESIQDMVNSQLEERKYFEQLLQMLKSSEERAVIRMRYFDSSSWDNVTDMMFGSKNDFLNKEDTYLRRVHRIHTSALRNLTILITEKGL